MKKKKLKDKKDMYEMGIWSCLIATIVFFLVFVWKILELGLAMRESYFTKQNGHLVRVMPKVDFNVYLWVFLSPILMITFAILTIKLYNKYKKL